VFIEDGPHAGKQVVPPHDGDILTLADPGTSAMRPATFQRYRLVPSHPDDFVQGFEARYRWEP
jgi:hypothetical protein